MKKSKKLLRQLTQTSYIMETPIHEKQAIIIVNRDNTILVLDTDTKTNYKSIEDFSLEMNYEFEYIEKKVVEMDKGKTIDEYPTNETDLVLDLNKDENGLFSFRKSDRSKKRFYPGWWVVTTDDKSETRLTISTELYETGNVKGPFKTSIEANFELKQ